MQKALKKSWLFDVSIIAVRFLIHIGCLKDYGWFYICLLVWSLIRCLKNLISYYLFFCHPQDASKTIVVYLFRYLFKIQRGCIKNHSYCYLFVYMLINMVSQKVMVAQEEVLKIIFFLSFWLGNLSQSVLKT